MDVNALLAKGQYQSALDEGGVAALPLLVERLSATEANDELRAVLVKAGSSAIAPLLENIAELAPQVRLERVRILAEMTDLAAKQPAGQQARYFKDKLRAYWRAQGLAWWDRTMPSYPVCNQCTRDVRRGGAYYLPLTGPVRCEGCAERWLQDWHYTWDYFGATELADALSYQPAPRIPGDAAGPPKLTLYGFEVHAATRMVPGRTTFMGDDDDGLKRLMRKAAVAPEAAVVLIPPADWSPPGIGAAEAAAIQAARPAVEQKVMAYLQRCGITNVSAAQLATNSYVAPDEMSGRIIFAYLVSGPPAQPQPAPQPQPQQPRSAPTPPRPPKYTLYAFEVRAASSGAPGVGRTVVIEAGDDRLQDMIRQRSNCPDASVVIVPPKEWSPPAIATVEVTAIQRAVPVVNRKVMDYLKRRSIPFVSEAQLIATGNILPNPMSGRILFVYRLEGQPAMKPSLATPSPAPAGAPAAEKKWWEFWKK